MASDTYPGPVQPQQDPNEEMLAKLGLHPMQIQLAQGLHSGAIPPQAVVDAVSTPKPAASPAPGLIAPPPDTSAIAPAIRTAPISPDSSVAPPTRLTEDQAELERLNRTGSGLEQFQHRHPVLGGIARIATGIGSAMFPGIAVNIPGTDLHHQMLVGQARGRVAEDLGEQYKQAQIEGEQAKTNLENRQADVAGNPKLGLTPEETTIHDLMTGENGAPRTNPETGKPYTYLEAFESVQKAKQDVKPQAKPDSPEQQFIDEYQKTHKSASIGDAEAAYEQTVHPQKPQQELGIVNGKVVEFKPGMAIPEGTTDTKGNKLGVKQPTADEQRRSDLARNLNENFDQLEDIVNRRPELFGPLAGRWTELKGKFGSDDPDVAALSTLEHQIGMAQISAHGMRSAHGIEGASQSILNGFHSGPNAIKGAIETARKSVATFQNDAGEATGSAPKGTPKGPVATENAEPERPANVPANFVYKKNGPKGEGWYRP